MGRTIITLLRIAAAASCLVAASSVDHHDTMTPYTQANPERSIKIKNDNFMLDGRVFRYVAGSLHYFRLPAEYWQDRLRKLRAAGLNAVSTYVEWSFHEPEERQYDWQGDHDLVRFVELAAKENLLVLLRPGPYICAERDLGGLPYWLLSKYPDIVLRTNDSAYMSEVETWMKQLFTRITPLLYGNGGPIIMVQVENEYGSYKACDGAYMERLRDLMESYVRGAALLYTTDGTLPYMLRCGSVNRTLTTVDFGTGVSPEVGFRALRQQMPHGPLVNSEFYPGWLTHWGESMQRVSTSSVVRSLMRMITLGASVNFYVFFGGTNFEFSAGANYDLKYNPDITSYDYDAPLTEYGDPTPKYAAIRAVLEQVNNWTRAIPVPSRVQTGAYGVVRLSPRVALLAPEGRAALGSGVSYTGGAVLPTFESMRQRAGLVLYETHVPAGPEHRLLHVAKPRDRALVYVDGSLVGMLSRARGVLSLPLVVKNESKLSLLVENQGRINYGEQLKDFKGILSEVSLDGDTLDGQWTILGYPLQRLDIPKGASCEAERGTLTRGPVLFEGSFTLPDGETPKDTFLNPTGWTKGWVWVNGHNLGRYWPRVGPQVTLYVPGVYLRAPPIANRLQLLELEASPSNSSLTVELVKKPIFFS